MRDEWIIFIIKFNKDCIYYNNNVKSWEGCNYNGKELHFCCEDFCPISFRSVSERINEFFSNSLEED